MATWWDSNYRHRRALRITNYESSSLSSSYAVEAGVDTSAYVLDNKMLSTGDDLRVVYWNGSTNTEIDRHILDMNTTSSIIVFKLQDILGARWTDDRYYMYYGYSSATNPASNKSNIYQSWNDFDSNDETGSWTKIGTGTFNVLDSMLACTGSGALMMIRKDTGHTGATKMKQMWIKIHPVKPTWWARRVMNWGMEVDPSADYYCADECCTGIYYNKNYLMSGGDATKLGVCRSKINNGSGSGTFGTEYDAQAEFKVYKFKWGNCWNEVYEGATLRQTSGQNVGMSLTQHMYMAVYGYGHTGSLLVDWIAMSPFTNNEPVVEVGNEEVKSTKYYKATKITGTLKMKV